MRQGYREVKEQTAHFFYNFEWSHKRIERKISAEIYLGNLPQQCCIEEMGSKGYFDENES